MAANTTRRSTRTAAKTTVKPEVAAPTKSIRPARRRPVAAKAPAAVPAEVKEVRGDALTSAAAPTLVGSNGELIRHTNEYTVDLLDPGAEPERDFGKILTKDPSETNLDFVAWVKKYVGYDADPKTVQILISTYAEFQKTPEQKAKTIAKREAAAKKRGEAAARKAAKAAAVKATPAAAK